MKKTNVAVVLTVLVLALSAHCLLSLKVCRPSSGSDFRGGECYMIKKIEQCGGSYDCSFHSCILPTACPFTKLNAQMREFYYSEVKEATEYGRTNYTVTKLPCYKKQTCSKPCVLSPDKDGYFCIEDGFENGPLHDTINLTGEVCDPHAED